MNEENAPTGQALGQTAICNVVRAVLASWPSDSMPAQHMELQVRVIKKVRGPHYLKPDQ